MISSNPDWQRILWALRKEYKPLAAIADEIGAYTKTLQVWARKGISDVPYRTGTSLIRLYELHVGADIPQKNAEFPAAISAKNEVMK